MRRAVHQLRDSPLVFRDPLAAAILGETYAERLRAAVDSVDEPFSAAFRAFLVARSRYAEDNLAQAVNAGVAGGGYPNRTGSTGGERGG